MLDSFDVDYIELETLMWQTGYLTIQKNYENFDGIEYLLNIPNQEVRISLLGSIADFMSKVQNSKPVRNNLLKALDTLDFSLFENTFKSLFASIPYNLFINNKMYEYEGYYVSLFYAYLKALGIEIVGEDVTNRGRIDLTIKMPNSIIIIEFKVDGSDALAQIKEKKYHEKYLDSKLPIYLVGIAFDTKDRNIALVEAEML